jgi:hypothetical protein
MGTEHSLTRAQIKQLRLLAGIAYERELSKALGELEAEFRRWRAAELSPFELSDRIHECHDGIIRDLWKLYHYRQPPECVARAVAAGILAETEIDPKLLALISDAVNFYRQWAEDSAASDATDAVELE